MQKPEISRERAIQTREYLHTARGIRQLIAALCLSGHRRDTQSGFVAAVRLSDREVLLVHEIEPHVLVRVASAVIDDQHRIVPTVELLCYVDRHGNYYPIALRGLHVGRAGQASKQQALSAFADAWCERLMGQGWVEGETVPIPESISAYLGQEVQLTEAERRRLEQWLQAQGVCEAIDGCFVRVHEHCADGQSSWFAALDLI